MEPSIIMGDKLQGRVSAVRGAVVDVAFPHGLPRINDALVIAREDGASMLAEVQAHLDDRHVRCIALANTSGLSRGGPVQALDAPLSVPVGDAVLGRLLDVTGTPRDAGPALPEDIVRRSIHRPPPHLPPSMPQASASPPGSRSSTC